MSSDPDLIPEPNYMPSVQSTQGSQSDARPSPSFIKRGGNSSGKPKFNNKGFQPYNKKPPNGRGPSLPSPSSFVSKKDRPAVFHQKQAAKPTGLQLYQVPTWYPVFVSNNGIKLLCETFFNSIEGRDQRMTTMVTLPQFEYVTCLSFIYRVLVVNRDNGNPGPYLQASDLRDAVKGLELPAPILRYLESVGIVTLPSGVKIGPYFTNDLYVDNHILNVTPKELLQDAARAIPPGHWSIDYQWIRDWNQHTTRMSRRSMGFGRVDYTTLEGKPDLCVTLHHIQGAHEIVQPLAPCQLSEEEAKLGACYQWRDDTSRDLWPGEYNGVLYPALRGSEFNSLLYFEMLATSYITHDG